MSLSDCPGCWDTPCSCGLGYKHISVKGRIALTEVILPPGYKIVKVEDDEKEVSNSQ